MVRLGLYAFFCSYELTSVSIPETVTEFDEWCFIDTKLTEINISKNVTTMYGTTFQGNKQLEAYNVEDGNSNYKSVDGVLFTSNMESILSVPAQFRGEDGVYVIPTTVTALANNAFKNCVNLTDVTIPESVTYMEASMFIGCTSLKRCKLPSTLETIPPATFAGCTSLTDIVIPESVTSIGFGAFGSCQSLVEIVIPDNVETMDFEVFQECTSLKKVTLSNKLKILDMKTFRQCTSLETILIPASVEQIGSEVFAESGITEINVAEGNKFYSSIDGVLYSDNGETLFAYPVGRTTPDYSIPTGVTKIGDSAFFGSLIESVTISSSVRLIDNRAFARCNNLTFINLEEGVEEIGYLGFYNLPLLTTITLPSTVNTIQEKAFGRCPALMSIQSLNPEPPVCTNEEIFDYDAYTNVALNVPEEAVEAYKTAEVWSNFENITGISGIADINADNASETWYTIGGVRLDGRPSDKGVYLRVSDKGVTRVMIND